MNLHFTGHGIIGDNDQVQLEFGAAYRHYHACHMRTVLTGTPDPEQVRMHAVAREALQGVQDNCKPGSTFGDVFDVYGKVMDGAGYRKHRMNACGYSLGALYPPTWMDYPMLYTGNPVVIEPNMVVFPHMVILDSDRVLTMAPGETVLVTETGCERLSRMRLDLVVK